MVISDWTFRALKESRFQIDYLAYNTMLEIQLKVLSSASYDEKRTESITNLFEECCKDGLLSSNFVTMLTRGPFHKEGWTKEESQRLCKELWGDHESIPASWTRELKDKYKARFPESPVPRQKPKRKAIREEEEEEQEKWYTHLEKFVREKPQRT